VESTEPNELKEPTEFKELKEPKELKDSYGRKNLMSFFEFNQLKTLEDEGEGEGAVKRRTLRYHTTEGAVEKGTWR
jgi:hypothetical protein